MKYLNSAQKNKLQNVKNSISDRETKYRDGNSKIRKDISDLKDRKTKN